MAACLPVPNKRKGNASAAAALPPNPSIGDFATAEEYMAYVQSEASNYNRAQTSTMTTSTAALPSAAPSAILPSSTPALLHGLLNSAFPSYPPSLPPPPPEWLQHAHDSFTALASYVTSIPISKSNPPYPPSPLSTLTLPPLKDYISWNLLLLPNPAPDSPDFQNLYTNPSTRAEHDLFLSKGGLTNPTPPLSPTPPLLLRMDHVMTLCVLRHLCRNLAVPALTPFVVTQDLPGRLTWIYALLSPLPSPPQMDTASDLRNIARTLATLRVGLAEGGHVELVKVVDGVGVALVKVFGVATEAEMFGK